MENNFFNFNAFSSGHQCVRKLVAKDRQEEPGSCNQAKDPCGCLSVWGQTDVANLESMPLQITRNQPDAQRYDAKPAIVYAHRDAIDARNCQLPFYNLIKAHGRFQSIGEQRRMHSFGVARLSAATWLVGFKSKTKIQTWFVTTLHPYRPEPIGSACVRTGVSPQEVRTRRWHVANQLPTK